MKEEEWKAVYVTHDGKLVHNLGTRIQLISKALERGYDKTSGKSGGEYLQTEYLKNEDEYLVSGAQLRCSMATSKKMTIEGRTYVPENPSETTYLECEENRMESGGGKVNATTKDCVVYKNIKPFRCNCRVGPCDDEEKDMLLVDESCLTDGTCKALIDLSEHWDNYPSQIPHFRYNDERFGEVSGITMMSMLFCKHGGIITPVTSGQERSSNLKKGGFVGYLAYGAEGITLNPEEGYYMLYDGPTVTSEGREYYFEDIYGDYEKIGGALQGYGGSGSILNDKSGQIKAEEMRYGTCADITICIDNITYYIPAVIVDVKAHTNGSGGYFQTYQEYREMSNEERQIEMERYGELPKGNIVEWYVEQKDENGNNKSSGLRKFDTDGGIIIYDGETMARNEK